MVVGLDNLHLQQHLIDKIQERAEKQVAQKDGANPEDVKAFQEQMASGEQNSQQVQGVSAKDATEKVNDCQSVKSPGEQILDKLESMGQDKTAVEALNQHSDPMSVSEEVRLNIRVTKLGAEESVVSATIGKASKDIDSLLKQQ
ncbi:MAG: hypothetical protein GDA45_02005 [Chromatiales bacterium]|nr:hypothetical protein [Chromatiales bacterium]